LKIPIWMARLIVRLMRFFDEISRNVMAPSCISDHRWRRAHRIRSGSGSASTGARRRLAERTVQLTAVNVDVQVDQAGEHAAAQRVDAADARCHR